MDKALNLAKFGSRFGFLRVLAGSNLRLIGRLLGDQGRKHWKGYAFALVMTVIVAWTTTMSAWIMRDVINEIFVAKKLAAVWIIGGVIVAIYTVKGFATYGQTVVLSRVANAIVAEVQRRIFDKMLAMSLGYYSVRHSTEFIARQAFISQSASGTLNLLITVLARDVLTLIGLAGVMIAQDPLMSALALIVTPFVVVGIRELGGRVKKVMLNEFYGFSTILESLQETVQGIRVVKAFALEPYMRARQGEAIASFERAANKLSTVGRALEPADRDAGRRGDRHRRRLRRPQGDRIGPAAGRFLRLHHRADAGLRAGQAGGADADRPHFVAARRRNALRTSSTSRRRRPSAATSRSCAIDAGRIEFRDVRFAYRQGEPVLRGLNLVAEPGRTTALVGRSGGGKTTAMNLILRFYEPDSGAVLDRRPGHRQGLARLAAPPASPTSARRPSCSRARSPTTSPSAGRAPAREEIEAAAKAAHAHDFILGFAQRLRQPVRRARHAAFRRPAPAHRHRPRVPQGRADHPARRSDLGARFRIRARGAGGAEDPVRRPHDAGHRPPADHRRSTPTASASSTTARWRNSAATRR